MSYREVYRRWSTAYSSLGHSQASAQSLQSIGIPETERKISFALHEPENVSGGSNVTVSLTVSKLTYLLVIVTITSIL